MSDQPRISPNPNDEGVILHLPNINYLDTQIWSVDVGLTASGLAALRDAVAPNYALLIEVLTIFAKADSHDTLLWWAKPEGIELWANVSDVFAWGGADAEAITPDRLPVLRQALADLVEARATGWIAELYTARIRGMRPQGAAYPTSHAVQQLLNACGPERPRDLLNPRPIPAAKEPTP